MQIFSIFIILVLGFSINTEAKLYDSINTGAKLYNSNTYITKNSIQKSVLLPQNTNSHLLLEDTKQNIVINIKKGMSLNDVAIILVKKNIINNVLGFKVLAFILRQSTKIKSGEYVFKEGSSVTQVLNTLVEGNTHLYSITFPEGYNMYEMAQLLEKHKFLRASEFISLCNDSRFINTLLNKEVVSLEGYLFPSTYYIPKPVRAKVLIRQMVNSFLKVYNKISKTHDLTNSLGTIALNSHEVVILASIVEKETGLAKERPLIASVFYNRLKQKMRLESDPTTLYGMMREAGGLVTLDIRKKDLLKKNLYNTYRIYGFPVGPISNPGFKALEAVFKPQLSSFFYFVSKNDGSHVFSETYKEHRKAVYFYQKLKK